MKLFSKLFKKKSKASQGSNIAGSGYGGNENDMHNEGKIYSVNAIMEEYNLIPLPFDLEGEMREWFDSFAEVKERELSRMNVDLDNFDMYEAEIDAHIRDAINTLETQYIDHKRLLLKFRDIIRGKIVRYHNQEERMMQDLEKVNRELEELSKKKKAYGGI